MSDYRQQQENEEQEQQMNVFQKLQEARVRLQRMELKKSGQNKFAGYQYFELGDFLPTTQQIFREIGLCGVVSFSSDVATLCIYDVDNADALPIVFNSPMGSASLKGCHEVQNIGAVETYQRRYLWGTAMEIVEHDALDATTQKGEIKPMKHTPNDGAGDDLNQDQRNKIADMTAAILAHIAADEMADASVLFEEMDNAEMRYCWHLMKDNSAERRKLKEYRDQSKKAA